MRCVGLGAYLMLSLLVALTCDALATNLVGPVLHARGSGSESSDSLHHDVHPGGSKKRPTQSRPPVHSGQSTQSGPAQTSHFHPGNIIDSSSVPRHRPPGQPGHLVGAPRPASRPKSYKQETKAAWSKQKGSQPASPRSKSRSAQASQAHQAHLGSASGSSSTDPEGQQAGKLGHLTAMIRPGAKPPTVKQDRKVAWWKQAGGQPRRSYGTSPLYDHHKLYRERKKFRKELQDLLEKPSEHPRKPPHGKRGGREPGSPDAGGSSHAVSKRQLRAGEH